MCPMRFNRFPMDEHTCKFRVGSTSFNDERMVFQKEELTFEEEDSNTILDYQVDITALKPEDTIVLYGAAGNYSVTGFEMTLKRNVAKSVRLSPLIKNVGRKKKKALLLVPEGTCTSTTYLPACSWWSRG